MRSPPPCWTESLLPCTVCSIPPKICIHSLRSDGEELVCDEGDLAWITKEDRPSLPAWEGDRVFLNLLAQERPFFSLKLIYHGDALASAVLDGKPLPLHSV